MKPEADSECVRQITSVQQLLGKDELNKQKGLESRKRKHVATALPPISEGEEDADVLVEDAETTAKKKASNSVLPAMKDILAQAQNAKKEVSKLKKQKEKVMAEASSLKSLEILPDQSLSAKVDQISSDLAEVKLDLKRITNKQETLINLIEPLVESIQCNQCLRLMYKGNKKSLKKDDVSSPLSVLSVSEAPTTFQQTMSANASTPKTCPLTSSASPSHTLEKGLVEMDMSLIAEEKDARGDEQTKDDAEYDLVYLGEVKYGVQMKKEELSKCLELSSTPEKLALNLLEFLVTKEDCRDMTVYGHGKQKKEMAPNLRRAIRSQVFSRYCLDRSEEEKSKLWMEKIVQKMNDKIRGIKNGKYKCKK